MHLAAASLQQDLRLRQYIDLTFIVDAPTRESFLLFEYHAWLILNTKCVFDLLGLETDGIYRVSGNLATIQKLRFVVDQGRLSAKCVLF